jgi:transposase
MPRAYSIDLRERVVASVRAGRSCRATATLFGVSVASVVKWAQRARTTGSVAPKPLGGRRALKLSAHRDWLLSRIGQPGVTLRSLVAELAARGVRTSYGAVWLFARREGLSFQAGGPARRRAGPARRGPAARPVAAPPGPA